MSDYIKLSRNILEWEWWHDINTFRVFIFLLLKANWKDGTWKGVMVKRGSYISSLDKLAEDTDLTRDEVRTVIKHLIKTKEITTHATRKYTVFTVVNYDFYQNNPTQITTQIPDKSPTIPLLFPSIEEKKEGKKGRNNNIFVPPSVDEVKAYCQERKNSVEAQSFVDFYTANGWVQGKGKPIKDWKACVRTWEKNQKSNLTTKNKFNQFEQRDYDFNSIEEKLLSRK